MIEDGFLQCRAEATDAQLYGLCIALQMLYALDNRLVLTCFSAKVLSNRLKIVARL